MTTIQMNNKLNRDLESRGVLFRDTKKIRYGVDEHIALIVMLLTIPTTIVCACQLGRDRGNLAILIGVPVFAMSLFYRIIRDTMTPGRAEIYAENSAMRMASIQGWLQGDSFWGKACRWFLIVGLLCTVGRIVLLIAQMFHLIGKG